MELRDRFETLLDRADLRDPQGRAFAELVELYGEKHRAYHDLRHIEDCLGLLDTHCQPGTDVLALELAFWFHDAIYAPFRGDNEAASADLAGDRLQSMGAGDALRRKVRQLILITQHDAEPRNGDEALMVDIDLAILGSERPTFERYEAAIRKEYRLVPGPLYRRKRKEILRSFLERPGLYFTRDFVRDREARARENLEWAISRL